MSARFKTSIEALPDPVLENIFKMLPFPDRDALIQAKPSLKKFCDIFEKRIVTRSQMIRIPFNNIILDCQLCQNVKEIWVSFKLEEISEVLLTVKRNLVPGVSYDFFPVHKYRNFFYVFGEVASARDRLTITSYEPNMMSKIIEAEITIVYSQYHSIAPGINRLSILPSSLSRNSPSQVVIW